MFYDVFAGVSMFGRLVAPGMKLVAALGLR